MFSLEECYGFFCMGCNSYMIMYSISGDVGCLWNDVIGYLKKCNVYKFDDIEIVLFCYVVWWNL